jgi:hypothetical protein
MTKSRRRIKNVEKPKESRDGCHQTSTQPINCCRNRRENTAAENGHVFAKSTRLVTTTGLMSVIIQSVNFKVLNHNRRYNCMETASFKHVQMPADQPPHNNERF